MFLGKLPRPGDARAVLRACFALLVVITACRKPVDDCEGAVARLARIDETKGLPAMSRNTRDQMIEACRTGKHASYDPVLRCLMDSSTDDEAATCIDRGIKDVVKGSAGDSAGSGLNPLLQ
jgi:hypothetical protein